MRKKTHRRVMLGLLGMVAIFLFAACSGTDYPQAPPAPIVVEVPDVQVQVPAPERQEPSPTPEIAATATQELATPASETQSCDLFKNMNISVVYLDWMREKPLEFYFKMPGGVPGLEKTIPDTSNTWEYTGKIGDHLTTNCEFVSGYAERLYCRINLPAEYAYTARDLSLSLSGCESPVYTDSGMTVPEFAN
ncbi:MAG: hypothetical protein GY755_25625 [Chloroflexi bacterium]|nr:hypothetical protein [Chloroflexota bacterium]